jgi:hypothetical protein
MRHFPFISFLIRRLFTVHDVNLRIVTRVAECGPRVKANGRIFDEIQSKTRSDELKKVGTRTAATDE